MLKYFTDANTGKVYNRETGNEVDPATAADLPGGNRVDPKTFDDPAFEDHSHGPLQVTTHDGVGYVDPEAVTHIVPNTGGKGAVIGTAGGLLLYVLEDVATLAKMFGFL